MAPGSAYNFIHGVVAGIGVETGHALLGTSEQGAEKLVKMGQKEAESKVC